MLSSLTTRTGPSLTPTRPDSSERATGALVGLAEAEVDGGRPGTELVAATADSDGEAVPGEAEEPDPPPPVHAARRAPAATTDTTRAGWRGTRKEYVPSGPTQTRAVGGASSISNGRGHGAPPARRSRLTNGLLRSRKRRPGRLVVEPPGEHDPLARGAQLVDEGVVRRPGQIGDVLVVHGRSQRGRQLALDDLPVSRVLRGCGLRLVRGVREEQAGRRVEQAGMGQLGGGRGATYELRVECGARCLEAYVQAIEATGQRAQVQRDHDDAARPRPPTTSS